VLVANTPRVEALPAYLACLPEPPGRCDAVRAPGSRAAARGHPLPWCPLHRRQRPRRPRPEGATPRSTAPGGVRLLERAADPRRRLPPVHEGHEPSPRLRRHPRSTSTTTRPRPADSTSTVVPSSGTGA
jgi:hypothetical protein